MAEGLADENRALRKALREIIERWDGCDDCTAAVARARELLKQLGASNG